MQIALLNNIQLKELINKLNLTTYDYNNKVKGYENFRFLLDIDFLYDCYSFVVAYDETILYGLIKLIDTTYKSKRMKGISFIDINANHKNKGIATTLLKYFDKINESKLFLSSKPCEEGKKYNIDNTVRKITDKKVVFV